MRRWFMFFFFCTEVLFRRRFCPSITQQLDRCNPKLYLFDNPVAKCMCNNSRRGWLSSTSVSALRRGRWPLPTGLGLVPNHRHVNTTLTGGIYRMVQSNSSARWAFEIPSSVVRNRSIARVRHRTHRVLYSSMVAALADFNLVTVVLGLRARKCRLYPGDKYRMACIAHRSWDGE